MLILSLLATLAHACSPYPTPQTLSDHLANSTDAFVATASGPEKPEGEKQEGLIPIRILHAFKGNASGSARFAQVSRGTCGYRLVEGATYLLFATRDGEGVYSASSLDGSTDLARALPLLHELMKKSGAAPKAEASGCAEERDLAKRKACDAKLRTRLAETLGAAWLK